MWLGEREARKSTTEALAGLAATLTDRLDRWISLRVGTVDLMAKVMSADARSSPSRITGALYDLMAPSP